MPTHHASTQLLLQTFIDSTRAKTEVTCKTSYLSNVRAFFPTFPLRNIFAPTVTGWISSASSFAISQQNIIHLIDAAKFAASAGTPSLLLLMAGAAGFMLSCGEPTGLFPLAIPFASVSAAKTAPGMISNFLTSIATWSIGAVAGAAAGTFIGSWSTSLALATTFGSPLLAAIIVSSLMPCCITAKSSDEETGLLAPTVSQ